jgi:hypothetical protein
MGHIRDVLRAGSLLSGSPIDLRPQVTVEVLRCAAIRKNGAKEKGR